MSYYCRTVTYPSIFSEFFVPEGYKLVEDEDYKKKKLENELIGVKNKIEYFQEYLVEAEEKRKKIEDELKELK